MISILHFQNKKSFIVIVYTKKNQSIQFRSLGPCIEILVHKFGKYMYSFRMIMHTDVLTALVKG